MEAEWLKVTEVARRLGVSEDHVRNLCRKGELPHRRNGDRGTFRIHWSAVELMGATGGAPVAARDPLRPGPAPPSGAAGFLPKDDPSNHAVLLYAAAQRLMRASQELIEAHLALIVHVTEFIE